MGGGVLEDTEGQRRDFRNEKSCRVNSETQNKEGTRGRSPCTLGTEHGNSTPGETG